MHDTALYPLCVYLLSLKTSSSDSKTELFVVAWARPQTFNGRVILIIVPVVRYVYGGFNRTSGCADVIAAVNIAYREVIHSGVGVCERTSPTTTVTTTATSTQSSTATTTVTTTVTSLPQSAMSCVAVALQPNTHYIAIPSSANCWQQAFLINLVLRECDSAGSGPHVPNVTCSPPAAGSPDFLLKDVSGNCTATAALMHRVAAQYSGSVDSQVVPYIGCTLGGLLVSTSCSAVATHFSDALDAWTAGTAFFGNDCT